MLKFNQEESINLILNLVTKIISSKEPLINLNTAGANLIMHFVSFLYKQFTTSK